MEYLASNSERFIALLKSFGLIVFCLPNSSLRDFSTKFFNSFDFVSEITSHPPERTADSQLADHSIISRNFSLSFSVAQSKSLSAANDAPLASITTLPNSSRLAFE